MIPRYELRPFYPNAHVVRLYELAVDFDPVFQYNSIEDFVDTFVNRREGWVVTCTQPGAADEEVVGYVLLSDRTPVNAVIHVLIHPDHRRVWASRRLCVSISQQLFDLFQLRRISAYEVVGLTDHARALVDNFGFVPEGCVRQVMPVVTVPNTRPELFDVALFGMLREECKWLRPRKKSSSASPQNSSDGTMVSPSSPASAEKPESAPA